jgi:(p)ppGpp synthase/HD superfamily hydrolase
LATLAHAGQVDKDGVTPYINHPMTIMLMVERFGTDAMIVAVLHDVLEDTEVSVDDLREAGATDAQITALIALTRHNHERYSDYIDRCLSDPLAAIVKVADHDHNNNPKRLARIDPKEANRLRRKYASVADKIDAARQNGAQ